MRTSGSPERTCGSSGTKSTSAAPTTTQEAVFSLGQLWTLAQRWYGDRLDPEWTPHDPARNQHDLSAAGLEGEFWQLREP
jgi:hypothetical protein